MTLLNTRLLLALCCRVKDPIVLILPKNRSKNRPQIANETIAAKIASKITTKIAFLLFKVVIDKVDPYYLHNPKSRINISEDTRLNMTTTEATEWIEKFSKEDGFNWKDPKFTTECWYLTLYAHHLSILPCIRRYQRRLRAIR